MVYTTFTNKAEFIGKLVFKYSTHFKGKCDNNKGTIKFFLNLQDHNFFLRRRDKIVMTSIEKLI